MLVSEQVVQAALEVIENGHEITEDYMLSALTAALPFLTGVKVKALEWQEESGLSAAGSTFKAAAGTIGYRIFQQSPKHKLRFLVRTLGATSHPDNIVCEADTLVAAKSAAQADYEARILSALEPFANSYPQGADLAAQSKNEDGSYKEPSPRAKALEEGGLLNSAALIIEGRSTAINSEFIESLSNRKAWEVAEIIADHDIRLGAAIRALSSQPVADGWLPTHRHKKRGSTYQVITVGRLQASAPFDNERIVIYRGEDGQYWARPTYEFYDGRFEALPASPGAPE
ncbi:hypothetical protein [Brucella pituitosa]|uniref:hypothetical protein n=1 Tax=Brucella pituitosa TaxID=571256 RepID=UPI003F4A93AA